MIGWQVNYSIARKCEQRNRWTLAASLYEAIIKTTKDVDARVYYRLGNAKFRLEDNISAKHYIETAISIKDTEPIWLYRLGFIQERLKEWSNSRESYEKAISITGDNPEWHYRLSGVLSSLKMHEQAKTAINKAISIDPSESKYYAKLASIAKISGELWQEIEILEMGQKYHSNDSLWYLRLGEANQKMLRFRNAAESFRSANTINPNQTSYLYREAQCWELSGNTIEHDVARKLAIRSDKTDQSDIFGYGKFLEDRGKWAEAIDEYSRQLDIYPTSALLKYRLGTAYSRTYDWAKAEYYLGSSLQMEWENSQLHYRLGFVLERQKKWADAAASYTNAIALQTTKVNKYWTYRLGYVLNKGAEYESACKAFLMTVASPIKFELSNHQTDVYRRTVLKSSLTEETFNAALRTQRADACFRLGDIAINVGELEFAANCFREGLRRENTHISVKFEIYAQILFSLGNFQEASKAFLNTYIYKGAHGVDTKKYSKKHSTRIGMNYVEYIETLSIDDNIVLFESSHGSSAGCNPLRISLRLLEDPNFSHLIQIWVINNPADVPASLRHYKNIIFVARGSDLYLRYLASAKYLVNNNTFPPYFIRRDEQKYLNTWHGTPIKTLGKDIKGGFMEHRNAARNFLHCTHILAPNDYTANLLMDKYDVQSLAKTKVAVTGYPRVDSTLDLSPQMQKSIRTRLKIQPTDRVVLYAPTWRGNLNETSVGTQDLVSDLNQLSSLGLKVLFRGHAMTESLLTDSALENFVVPKDIDTNDLLAVVDILITDYSSILFDFLPLKRQIILYAYDEADYRSERGLYLDLADLPVSVCRTISDIESEISAGHQVTDTQFQPSLSKFCSREDGHATDRAVDFFFKDSRTDILTPASDAPQKNLLMYQGSFIPNGITSSYLSLVDKAADANTRVTVVLEPSAMASDERRLEMFGRNPQHVQVIGRVGDQVVSAEERWVIDRFNIHGSLDSQEQYDIYNRAFNREYRRMFGSADFDAIICFEGYARFWAALLGNSGNNRTSTSIYLHNDMMREWITRFHYLESLFRLYPRYDNLISVAKSVHDINMSEISSRFNISSDKFTFANNVIDPVNISNMSLEPLDSDVSDWIQGSSAVFISVGRLSPEKDHKKLVEAFRKVVDIHRDAKLLIVGDGPLKDVLQRQIFDLGLYDNILLAGLRLNPYPLITAADCFVFSSNYEGQGLVVLEALVLGLPAISTDVVGPRSILENGSGLLVENSVNGLFEGMHKYMGGKLDLQEFDSTEYVNEAVSKFRSILSLE